MKFISLLPLGAALLLSLPAAAQTVEKKAPNRPAPPPAAPTPPLDGTSAKAPTPPVPPAPPTEPAEVPVPPDPPTPPAAPEAYEATEDFVIEAPIPAEGIETSDVVVESANPLRDLKIDSLNNMLRIRIRKSVQERDGMRRDVEKLSGDLSRKNREFCKLRLDAADGADLAKALEEARLALDSAQATVLKLDSHLVFIRSHGRDPMVAFNRDSVRIMYTKDRAKYMRDSEAFTKSFMKDFVTLNIDSAIATSRCLPVHPNAEMMRKFSSYQFSDSLGGYGKHIVIMKSFEDGDSVAGMPLNDPFRSFGGSEANVMMLVTGDSAGDSHSMAFINKMHGAMPRGFTMQHSFDSSNGHQTRTIVIRSTCGDSTRVFQQEVHHSNGSPFNVCNSRIVVGRDSLRIVDGKDEQMVIRVDRTSTAHGRAQVVIITTSRGKAQSTVSEQTQPEVMKRNGTVTSTSGFALEANTPNPFSESTTISFTLPKPEHVTLTVFDANGSTVKVLKDEELPAGTHTAVFNASEAPSGIYLYRLVAGGFSETKTMTIAK
jgi:Secretion system C-terminal sorting domain